ncbi:cholesterol transporter ABCA5 isoform X1 [Phalacrocorax carbo]|uniref:Cholesterol transporter ABCA5 n=1 Tax=Phalacrocorax carbo TaxID=9209 RepID=A0A093QS75_PHACA|nr:PREDICTED: ATP-binding cassette sub-family A member 5 [Phalacrocorax carbo]KFW91411.1 ATP-binding cassette sub-family A member 5 [Phalacrocorax carbo]
MAPATPREAGVWRQTRALLFKNCLIKCRTKKSSVQEVLFPLFFLFWLILMSMMHPHRRYGEVANTNLGTLDTSMLVNFVIGYTPPTRMAREIMKKVAFDHFEDGIITEEYLSEEELQEASAFKPSNFVGVVFNDAMSYQLRFPDSVAMSSIYMESRASCSNLRKGCESVTYWSSGFTALQACIDAAIVQLKTNQSVWEQLELTRAMVMGEAAVVEIDNFPRAIILIYLVIAFSPFGYYLAIHIVAEKERKLKEFLKILGLHDTAFWLSWVLLYMSLIFVMSILMAVIATASSLFPQSSAFVIFLLFFLYGISSVFFALMLTPLFKKSKHVGIVEFLATLAFGFVGLNIVLLEDFPKSFVWILSPLCQCSFLIGIAQVMHLEDYEDGATFSNLNQGPYPLFISLILLVLDSIFYLLVAVYLDQVIPGEFGLRRTPFFFMKPSFWSKHRKNYKELYESSINGSFSFSEIVEPVPSEFQGKEAIRISCVQKTFRKKGETVEALRNLSFDIYEGQITALLGHSGTGKTTLMNILCGLCPPTDGFVSVYGHKVSEIDEMLEVRQIAGVCPQSDIHFDILTVEENLSIFAAIKGIPQNDLIQEVQKVLLDLDMQPIRDNQAKKLSGGQKRRLSVGVAVLGNPKVLLLDEPTAGMDPCSRHIVWNLLKNRKANRVTVFSTHFMDEADILADRKAVISQGMLKCLGSSLFLKSKWGIGYRLSMHIDAYCNTEATTSLIRQHVPAASLIQENDEQLVYTLPLKDMDKFAGLFSDLDTHSHLGVITYGVSMTTLEDVYLKLEVEAEIDQADYSVFSSQQVQDEMDTKSLDDMEQSLLMLSETKAPAMSNTALWKKQVSTIAKVHFLSLKRENKCVRVMLLLFLIFLVVQILLFFIHHIIKNSVAAIRLSPDLYLLKPGEDSHKYRSRLLLQNSTESDINDIVRSLGSMNILLEMFNDSDYVSAAPHSAALNVFDLESRQNYVFTIIFNSTMVHSLPVLMNIVSNLLLRNLNVTESIEIWSNPFIQNLPDTIFRLEIYFEAVLLGIIITGMPPYFAMDNAENHKIKAYTQLKIAGLYPSAYWTGQAVIDLPLFFSILVLMIGSLFAFHYGVYFYVGKFLAVIFCLIGYVPSVVLFTYVVSFTFKKVQNTKEFWSFIFSVTALLCTVVTEVAFFLDYYLVTTILHYVFSIFIPIYPLIGCLICFIKVSWKGKRKDGGYYDPWDRLLVAVIAPYLQCVVWLFLLRCFELKNGGRTVREDPFFRRCFTKAKTWKLPDVPHDENEDEDVKAERLRVQEILSGPKSEEMPAILVSSLHKEFDERKEFLLGRKIKKVATKHVSLCVKKGEILGLLGPNGAGKSTLINMLVGEVEPTSGQVLMGDYSFGLNSEDESVKFVGYCPQTNPLWPDITLQEHFEIYGAIKGMSQSDVKEVVKRIASALDLKDHLQKTTKKLGVGLKRKLCFALSMLGNPRVTLLDEPSTGMDPKAKQHMWRAIRAAFKNKERAAILTTHYMEEADAVCDRVAILVSGQLRCIGTVQHLKSKFGRGYFLEMKLKETADVQQVEYLQSQILYIFPNANRQESFASILAYKIPKEDVQSLSHSFSKLEEVKHAFNIEEYSFSQATLEQVFVELAKEQEEEDSSFGTLNSTLWWERTQEDRVVF